MKLVESQPAQENGGRYSFTLGGIATGLPRLRLAISKCVAGECENRPDIDYGDPFLPELIACADKRGLAMQLAGRVRNPENKAQAYFLIGARGAK